MQFFQWQALMMYIPSVTTYFARIIYNNNDDDYYKGVRTGAIAVLFQSVIQFLFPLCTMKIANRNLKSLKWLWTFSLFILMVTSAMMAVLPNASQYPSVAYIEIAVFSLTGIPKRYAFVAPFAYTAQIIPSTRIVCRSY